MKRIFAIAILLAAAVGFAANEERWTTGAVGILITKSERDAFKALKTDSEKDQFIKDFWAKRNATSGTAGNDFKGEFERAMQQVDTLKIPSTKRKGSQTDMGAVLLLLGKPAEQKTVEPKVSPSTYQDEDSGAMAEGASIPTKQVWTFRNLPSDLAAGELQIEFVADPGSGEWRFADSKKTEVILDKAREGRLKMAQEGRAFTVQGQTPSVQTAPPASMPEEKPITTPELKAALDAAAAGSPPKTVSFDALTDGLSSSRNEGFATVAIRTSADIAAAKVGIRLLDPNGTTIQELEMPFVQPGEEAGYFQTRLLVPNSGPYTELVGIVSGKKAGAKKLTVTIPDSAKFSISSLILAKTFSQLPEPKPEKEPYTFGKIKVMPNIGHIFSQKDNLIIAYEAYNFQVDPSTNQHNLETSIEFQKENDKPQITPPAPAKGLITGKKILISTSFPLAEFPVGKYTLTLHLTDKATNQALTEQTSFTVTK